MRIVRGFGLVLVLASAALADGSGGVLCLAEIDVTEEDPASLTPQQVWAKAAQIPGFAADTSFTPILMEPSAFKEDPLSPGLYSYVVRGTLGPSNVQPAQLTAAQMGDDCGVIGFLKLCPQTGQTPFIPVQINDGLAACDQAVVITIDPIMVPPEPDTAPSVTEGGSCAPPWTPVCTGGSCPFGDDCAEYPWEPGDPCGELADIATARALQGVDDVHCLGLRGEGVIIGIVDGGIDDSPGGLSDRIRAFDTTGALFGLGATENVVVGGWPTSGPNTWGTAFDAFNNSPWGDHGPMTASNALAMAPKARIYDIRINAPCPQAFCPVSGCGRLSNALAGFDWAIRLPASQRPDILSNSWGVFRVEDAPDYAVKRSHWFNRKIDEAVAAGITVVFAAGNTGPDHIFCPPCAGSPPVGMPGPIIGGNGHPDVITVGAVNAKEEYVAYSTPGGDTTSSPTPAPGLFDGSDDSYKPDVLGPVHLNVYWGGIRAPVGGVTSDAGTSTACASVAGQIALLKQAAPSASAADLETALKSTAEKMGSVDVSGLPWGDYNYYTGFGRLQTFEALRDLTVHCPDPLDATITSISLTTGGTQPLGVCAGATHAGKLYLMLGSTKICPTGSTTCGLMTPVGNTPLDFSGYFFWTLNNPNNALIPKSVGFLDADGTAVSSFTIPPLPLSGSLANTFLYHAYSVVTVQDPFTAQFLSDAQSVLLTP